MDSKHNQEEYRIQAAVFAWAEIEKHTWPELRLLNGSLNGVRLTIGQAVKAKKAGMKKGYPDISLPIPKGKYHGLFIEVKTDEGRIDEAQKEWMRALGHYGYFACVCHGYESCIRVLRCYIDGRISALIAEGECQE